MFVLIPHSQEQDVSSFKKKNDDGKQKEICTFKIESLQIFGKNLLGCEFAKKFGI